ncbi:MAG: cytochrome c-type biosis protein CcmB [Bryobacterales bacterium]|nr:cytochrome c-type biosis protein CcmB [Bryobacterales bacterium]
MRHLRHAMTIAGKDLRSEFRGKEGINAAFSFSLVMLLIFSFAFDPTAPETRSIAGGLLWIVFTFAGALILNRSFARDVPNDCLDALIASPVEGWSLFLGKATASFLLLIGIETVCLPVFAVFYDISLVPVLGQLALVMVLGTWALTVVGTAFGALTVNVRLREIMLPMLLYPVMIPALVAAMEITAHLFDSGFTAVDGNWLRYLVGFDVIYTALAVALIDLVLVA